MAVVLTVSNHAKYQLAKKLIDLSADTLKIILMNAAFAFDKDTHATLALVTASQLATEYGYTQNDETLGTVTLTEDDTNDYAIMACADVTFEADGGSIGPTGSAIIYDDTTADDTVIGCIDFGTDYTVEDGNLLVIEDIEITVS